MAIPDPPAPARYIAARKPLKMANPFALMITSLGILFLSLLESVLFANKIGCGQPGSGKLTDKAFEDLCSLVAFFIQASRFEKLHCA